jgi:hypothetical protein
MDLRTRPELPNYHCRRNLHIQALVDDLLWGPAPETQKTINFPGCPRFFPP